MEVGNEPERAHSLAATASGDRVEIRRILFDAVRGLCADLGVREGDIVTCRADTTSHLFLETPGGRTVTLERDWARFIQVSPPVRTTGRRVPVPEAMPIPARRPAKWDANALGGARAVSAEQKARVRRATQAESAVTRSAV